MKWEVRGESQKIVTCGMEKQQAIYWHGLYCKTQQEGLSQK